MNLLSSTISSGEETPQPQAKTSDVLLRKKDNNKMEMGYVSGDPLAGKEKIILENVRITSSTQHQPQHRRESPKALFDSFDLSAIELNSWSPGLGQMYKMSQLASFIYAADYVEKLAAKGESLVATQTTANVKRTISDSLVTRTSSTTGSTTDGSEGTNTKPCCNMQRAVTIRGYDASDEKVDRHDLLYMICCKAQPLELR